MWALATLLFVFLPMTVSLIISTIQYFFGIKSTKPDETDNMKIIYHYHECDGCSMLPIVGNLYRCTICPDYDLCEKCNTQGIRPMPCNPDHVMNINFDFANEGVDGEEDDIDGKTEKKGFMHQAKLMIIEKAGMMPQPLRYCPGTQSVYHTFVLSKLTTMALKVEKKRKLLVNLENAMEGCSGIDESGIVGSELKSLLQTDEAIAKYRKHVRLWKFQEDGISKKSKKQIKTFIQSELKNGMQDLETKMSNFNREYLRTKIYEAFFESAPQFTLQLYIILSTGYFEKSQIFSIATSFITVINTSINIYLKMPLASGEFQHEDWRNLIFVSLPMTMVALPRLIVLAFVASLLKAWIFLIMVGTYVISLLMHSVAFEKRYLEDLLFGIYCPFFSSCIIQSLMGPFLVTSTIFPIMSMVVAVLLLWIGMYNEWDILINILIDHNPIWVCFPYDENTEIGDCFTNLNSSIIRCFNETCNSCHQGLFPGFLNEDLKTYCKNSANDVPTYIPQLQNVFGIFIFLLFLSLISTVFLRWYVQPLNRLWLSLKLPFINKIWEPSMQEFHLIAKDGYLKLLKRYPTYCLELPSENGESNYLYFTYYDFIYVHYMIFETRYS